MQIIEAIETEINDLYESGLLRWLENEEQELKLFENDLFLEILKMHGARSRIHSFLLREKDYHFILYYDEFGSQSHIRFLWNTEVKLNSL